MGENTGIIRFSLNDVEKTNPFNRRAYGLLIAGAFLFVLMFFWHHFVFPEASESFSMSVGVSERLPLRRVDFTPRT